MSVIEMVLFYLMIVLISGLQCAAAYIYFSGFFLMKTKNRKFFIITFSYMLFVKFIPGTTFLRIILLILFLCILSVLELRGTIEKKIYHVMSFSSSLTLCELTFSTFIGDKSMDIHTGYVKWIAAYFLINIFFFLSVICIIKLLLYFREENNEGLSKREYLFMSITPISSLIIICASTEFIRFTKIVLCFCLMCINFSYMIIYDWIGRKNFEIHRYSLIEEQNRYYQERIKNQKEFVRMQHDLKNILICVDSSIASGDLNSARNQLNDLLEIKALSHDEFTGCVAVDSILNVKIQKIRENKIKYGINLQIPCDLEFEDKNLLHVSAILGNLLDNAMEAVLRIENEKNRNVDIKISFTEGKLIFHIRNTSNVMEKDFSHMLIKSEKGKERYGIGLSSIKERVNTLHGHYDFNYEGGYYDALIIIPVK